MRGGDIIVTDKDCTPTSVKENLDGFTRSSGKVTIWVTYKPMKTPWNNPFTDIFESDWFYETIRFIDEQSCWADVVRRNHVLGRLDSQEQATRAETAQMLKNFMENQ